MRLFPGLFLLLLALAAVGATSPSDPARWPGPNPAAGVMGLHWFEPNMGQADGDVRFLSRGDGIRVGVSADCLHLVSRTPGGADQVRLRLLGANSSAQVRGEHPLRGHANCLLGNDPARWRRRVPLYRQVRAESVYPGIDLVCYRGGAGLEYDFQVAPGADPGQIRLACEGAARVETAGQELVFHTRYGAFRQQRPRVFQQRDGIEREIAASYRGRARPGAPAGFRLAAYDPALPLVIDPVLTYSTFLGGNRVDERIQGAAVDTAGMVYVTGQTPSTDFPTRNPAQPALGGGLATDAFVAKFDGSRTGADSLVYCTFLGGGNADSGHGVGVDSAGHAYVAGTTHSNDFPVMLPAQGVHGGRVDAFAARLAPDGSRLLYSTYLGGSDDDSAFNLAVTPAGTATVVGSTNSELLQNAAGMVVETSYPLVNPFQADLNRDGAPGMVGGFPDAFVTQLSPAGGINYSTYLGGARDDRALAAALDSAGNATITGDTTSANFPTTVGVVQPMFGSSSVLSPDGFLSRLSPTGEYRIGTYLGGPSVEIGRGVGVDAAGFAYVVLELLAGTGAEVRRLNTDLTAVLYSRPLALATVEDLTVAPDGVVHGTGSVNLLGGATGFDAAYYRIGTDGNLVEPIFRFGGTQNEFPRAVALDAAGRVWIGGETHANDFPVVNPFQPFLLGGQDAFLTRVENIPPLPVVFVVQTDPSASEIGPDPASFRLDRTLSTAAPLTVNLTLTGTATNGVDYTTIPAMVTIPAGQASLLVPVNPIAPDAVEGEETVVVTAVPSATYTVGNPGQTTITITDGPPPAPAAPANLRAVAVSSTGIDLTWEDRSNNETQFVVERRTGAGAFAEIGRVGANQTTFSDRGLTPRTAFTYHVKATNGGSDSAFSNEAAATTRAPAPPLRTPTSFTARVVRREGVTTVQLSWRDSNRTETGFLIQRRVGTAAAFAEIGRTGANGLAFTDAAPPRGTVFYRVQALGETDSAFTAPKRVTVR